jgi:hypothetical protein
MAESFDPYHVWLGIAPEEQPANLYRLLGLGEFENNRDVIDNAADRQMAHLRTFQSGKHGDLTQRLLNEVAAARICLLDAKRKTAYDQELHAKLAARSPAPATIAPQLAAGGSAIHRQRPRRGPTDNPGVGTAPNSSTAPAASNAPQSAVDQWDNLLGQSTAKPASRPAGQAGKSPAARQKVTSRATLVGVGVALVLVTIVGFGILAISHSEGTLVFDWPEAERVGVKVLVDNVPLNVPTSGLWEHHCPPGPHHLVAERTAFKIDTTIDLDAGERKAVAADWKSKAVLVFGWPLSDRVGAGLTVDGQSVSLPSRERAELAVEPGQHFIQIARAGVEPFETTESVAADGRKAVSIPPPSIAAVVDWPADQRKNAELWVDGQLKELPEAAQFTLSLSLCRHEILIMRPGYRPIKQSVDPGIRSSLAIEPTWIADDGRGLEASLYRKEFEELVKTRFDPQVNFEWGLNPPDPDMSHENYSIRWTGYLKAPRAGVYKLAAIADDWIRVKLDGEVVLEPYLGRVSYRREKILTLTGDPQPIEIEFVQRGGPAFAVFRWLPPGHITEEAIPPAAFFHDKRLAQSSVVTNTPDPAGNKYGLAGQFFDDMNLKHRVKTRLDPQIDFFWGTDPPDTDMGYEHWSARWEGFLVPPKAGEYKLAVVVDDGARLWLDDSLKIDSWRNQSPSRYEATVELDANPHRLRLEYFQDGYTAQCSLLWLQPGALHEETIPNSALIPATAKVETVVPGESKHAAPTAAEQDQISKQIDELTKTSRAGTSKTAKAHELYQLADQSKGSPAERFTLLLKGARLAAVAGDLKLAWLGTDTLEAEYQMDSLALRKELLEKAVGAVVTSSEAVALISAAEQSANEAVAADRVELALALVAIASKAAERDLTSARKDSEERLASRRRELLVIQSLVAAAHDAQETLTKEPANSDANLIVGQWRCLHKNDWSGGLPLLALGSDEQLKAAARQEIEAPEKAGQQIQLADNWWDLSQKESGAARESLRLHAGKIYQEAIPKLETGPKRAAIEQRLAEIAATNPAVGNMGAWIPLEVQTATSAIGAILTKESNDAVIASGKTGVDTYTITVKTYLCGITAFRLEAIADPRLPNSGPGRSPSGNQVLNEFRVTAAPISDPSNAQAVVLQNAQADFSQEGWAVAGAIDGDMGSGWGLHGQLGRDHVAIFECRQDIGFAGGTVLTFSLDQHYGDQQHLMGKFRLSATTEKRPVRLEVEP